MFKRSDDEQSVPWSMAAEDVLARLDVNPDQGLSGSEVQQRREKAGRNRLRTRGRRSAWQILIEQFDNIIIWLLLASALLSFIFGEWVDGGAVAVVIAINTLIGFFTELRAVRSMEALREMTRVDARVRRNGKLEKIPAEALVPGDIVVVEGGDIVTADLRILEASKLQANESALTGESEPVSKRTGVLAEDEPLAERENMLFKGTAVTRGSGEGVVVYTGTDTELGQISELVAEAEQEHTPLEKRLDQLGGRLVWVTLGIIVIVAITGVLRGKELLLMVETSVALAVAAVPEGLPIVATIALARGMRRMAEKNALINRLASVETLGGTNVICADKTGTLTENQMTVTRYVLASGPVQVSGEGLALAGDFSRDEQALALEDQPDLVLALKVGVLCSNAELQEGQLEEDEVDAKTFGEPVEVALLIAGIKGDLRRQELADEMPEAREVAFDPEVKMMATYHRQNGSYLVAVKGAPEAVLQASTRYKDGQLDDHDLDDEQRAEWMSKNEALADQGLRLLALAVKEVQDPEEPAYQDLAFLGLVAMQDPPRQDVRPAIQDCKQAGIQVAMVTGDQAVTARNIAQAVGLVDDEDVEVVTGRDLKPPQELDDQEYQRVVNAPIFARVSPKQKLDLIAIHQKSGAIVAMTGDGVNDAPALKKADIGIAMGLRGTQVAKEAADMVLKDDAFNTIVLAVRLGRVIFENIRRFVLYLISCNVSEILVVFLATMLNLPLPILPLQILFLNLVTDVFPALALGVGKGDPMIMQHPPRDPDEPVLRQRDWGEIGGFSAVITLAVLVAYWLASDWLGLDGIHTVTISFLTLAFAQLWHVFDMRAPGSDFFKNDVIQNPFVWGAVVLCVLLLLGAVYIPPLASVLQVARPSLQGWGLVLGLSLLPWVVGQVYRSLQSQA